MLNAPAPSARRGLDPSARRGLAVAALAVLAAALTVAVAACGSAAQPAVRPGPSRSGPSASPTSTASPTSSPAPTSAAACPASSLALKLGMAQGAAGSTYQVIEFTNTGSGACTLDGFPAVALTASKSGTQVQAGLPATEDHSIPPRLITLAPDGTANAVLRIVNAGNYPVARCQPAATDDIRVSPPGQAAASYLNYRSQTCTTPIPVLGIRAIQAGPGTSG